MDEEALKLKTENGILEIQKEDVVSGEFTGSGSRLFTDLLGEFLFEGSVKDSSGNNLEVVTKSILYTENEEGTASSALFSKGEGNYFYIKGESLPSSPKEFTISFRLWPVRENTTKYLVSQWKSTRGKKAEGRVAICYKDEAITFYIVDEKGNYQSLWVKDLLKADEWNNLAFTYKEGYMKIFHNGEVKGEHKISGTGLYSGEFPLYILTAAPPEGKGFSYYNPRCRLDDFRIFSKALREEDVADISR